MIATSFDESNGCLGAPQGMTPEEVETLSIWRGTIRFEGMEVGVPAVVSCWKPTPEELEEIKKTGRVWLVIMGISMPPACLMGTNPLKVI